MCRRTLLALGATAVFLTCSSAYAQPAPEERFHVGPYLTLTPTVTFVAGHDTNLIRTSTGEGGGEYYVAPQVVGWLGRGRTRVNFASALSYQGETAKNSEVWNHFNAARFQMGSSLFKVEGLASHRNHYAPPTDFVGFVLGVKSRRVENIFEGTATYAPGGRLSVGTVVRKTQLRYHADARFEGNSLQFQLNRDSSSAGGFVGMGITPFSSAVVTFDVTRDRFLYNPAADGNGFRLLGGAEFSPQALLTGRALVGYMRYKTLLTNRTYSAPSYLVGLSASRGPLMLDVAGSRVVDLSFDPSQGFYVTTGLDGYVSFRLRRSWETFARGSFRSLAPQGFVIEQPHKEIRVFKTGLAYLFGRFTRIGVELERYNWGDPGGFRGRRITMFVIYGSNRPIRLDRPLPGEF